MAQSAWNLRLKLATATLVFMSVAIGIGRSHWKEDGPLHAMLLDQHGKPRTDIEEIIGPNAESVLPDYRGIVVIPKAWADRVLTVRGAGGAVIDSIRLTDTPDMQRIRLPR